jgi:hypothetical protein
VELRGVPCEFSQHFDPHYPVVLGGLTVAEGTLQIASCPLTFLYSGIERKRERDFIMNIS